MTFGGGYSTSNLPQFTVSHSIARSLENPNTPLDPDFDDGEGSNWYGGDGYQADTGVKVTRKNAMGYTPYYRSLSLISGDAGRCPLVVYRKVIEEYGEGKEKATDHPAYKLLRRRPNKDMTANVWKETMLLHACDKGNGYSLIIRKNKLPDEIRLLDPDRTWPIRYKGELYYAHQMQDGNLIKLPAADVIHIKNVSWDGLSGMGWREIGKETLGLGIASRKFSTRFYKRGAVPSVVLEVPGKMNPKVARQLRNDWEKLQAGLENMHRTAILQQGTKAHVLSQSAKDSQMSEMQLFNVRMTSTLTGVPPHKLGDPTRQGYNSVAADNQSYLDEALDIWLGRLEEECEDKLLSDKEKEDESYCIEFNRAIFLQADLSARYAAYGVAKQNRFMTTNEIRARENLNPLEDGDELDATAQVQPTQPNDSGEGAGEQEPAPEESDDGESDDES